MRTWVMGINWYVLFDSNAGLPPRNNNFNPRWERKISVEIGNYETDLNCHT